MTVSTAGASSARIGLAQVSFAPQSSRTAGDDKVDLVIDHLAPEEAPQFGELLLAELPKYYDEVDESFPRSIVANALAGQDRYGYFTRVKRVFVGWVDGLPQAFTVVSYKRGGSVKVGPTVVMPEWRRQGLGRMFRRTVEQLITRDTRVRKLYLTINASNQGALLFNLGLGYRIEGVLPDHYRNGEQELVLGRIMRPGPLLEERPRRLPPGDFDTVLLLEGSVDIDEFAEYLLPRLAAGFSDLDRSFVDAVVAALEHDRQGYASKGKRLLTAWRAERLCGVAVLVPKRGGAMKVSPLIAEDVAALDVLVEGSVRQALSASRRKLYAVIPTVDMGVVDSVGRHGFHVEAQLREAYRAGVDALVLGRDVARHPHEEACDTELPRPSVLLGEERNQR